MNEAPITPELFLEWRSPRRGVGNPSTLTNPVWEWLVRTRMNAYQAPKLLGGPSALDTGPGWCFDRFGQTTTLLADGREVLIAGEHEDSYDPDFYIYSDVVVKAPDGEVTIYGYSEDAFPPTDFHTATPLPGSIVLIGSLGYQKERLNKKETQVLQLRLDDFSIHRIDAHGASPGWIHSHTAVLSSDGHAITVSGGLVDPRLGGTKSAGESRRLGARPADLDVDAGYEPELASVDISPHGSEVQPPVRVALSDVDARYEWNEDWAKAMQRLEANIGRTPDLDLIPMIYQPADSVTPLPQEEDRYNEFRVLVDDIVVRFTEEPHLVRAVVEGRLSQERLQALQEGVRDHLSALEGAAWELETL